MTLLDDIRNDLLNDTASLTTTLRKAKVLASQIALSEFREWVDFELGGYPSDHDVPEYRSFRPTNLGTFTGLFQTGAKNVPLPTVGLPDELRRFAETFEFREGIGELEAMRSEGTLRRRWPPEYVISAREHLEYSGGFVLIDAHQPVPGQVVTGVLDQVKNKLLDFVLSLQEENITPEHLESQGIPSEVVRNLFYINIYGNRNVVASGERVNQTGSSITPGDMQSLLDYLSSLGLGESDVNDLQAAVLADPAGKNGQVGPRVRAWLGGIVSKGGAGTLTIGIERASREILNALTAYYG